jgi:aryl carrier-like protein
MHDAALAEVATQIRSMLADRVSPEEVAVLADEEPLVDVGLESVGLITLVADLQRQHGVILDDELVLSSDTSIAVLARAVLAWGARR